MGLFSSHRFDENRPAHCASSNKLYVVATTQIQHESTEPRAWSIVVEQVPLDIDQLHDTKRSNSLFRRHNRPATSDPTSLAGSIEHSSPQLIELSLQDDQLRVSSLKQSRPAGSDGSVLVKILLPLQQPSTATKSMFKSSSSASKQSLSVQIEQLLCHHSHTSDTKSETWLRASLLALQNASILPENPSFNVNNLLAYAQDQVTRVESEVLGSPDPQFSSDGIQVKEIDYQAHLNDNARLRAMFGHATPEEMQRTSNKNSSIGGFWVTRPMNRSRFSSFERSANVYGGLM